MDQVARVRKLIERVTYKPDYSLVVASEFPVSGVQFPVLIQFNIFHPEPDVNHPSATAMISYGARLDEDHLEQMSDAQILEWIYHQLVKREIHEVREWFRMDGVPVRDPHPELKKKAG
jgi:hypothetical protein